MSTELYQALIVTYELMNQPMTDLALVALADDLKSYPLENVLVALRRCRSELKALRLTDILDRLPGGHPGPEEAWSLVNRALANEQVSIVWTDPMREAMGVARNLSSDPVAARMAFKETYVRLVSEARAVKAPVQWSVSLGYDPVLREQAQLEAVNRNRGAIGLPALPAPKEEFIEIPMPEEFRQQIARIGKPMEGAT